EDDVREVVQWGHDPPDRLAVVRGESRTHQLERGAVRLPPPLSCAHDAVPSTAAVVRARVMHGELSRMRSVVAVCEYGLLVENGSHAPPPSVTLILGLTANFSICC